jgi:hypothetical protein
MAEYLENKFRIREAILEQHFTTGVLCPIEKLLFSYTIASGERAVTTVVGAKVATFATICKNLMRLFPGIAFKPICIILSALKSDNKIKLEIVETIIFNTEVRVTRPTTYKRRAIVILS